MGWDAGKEGYMSGGMRETGKGGMQERTDERKEGSGQERCWTGRDTGKVGCRTGAMQDWRDARKEGVRAEELTFIG